MLQVRPVLQSQCGYRMLTIIPLDSFTSHDRQVTALAALASRDCVARQMRALLWAATSSL